MERFGIDHNPATVLDPEAVAELTALLGTVPDPAADLEIAYAAGWLHWCRYLVLEPGDDQKDLADALALFVAVYRTRPDAVPDQVRAALGGIAASDEPHAVADRAVALQQVALSTGDRAGLNTAIDLLQQAVAATPAGHPHRAAILANLAIALTNRFEWTGDRADLDAAITAGLQAVAAASAHHPDRAAILSNLGANLRSRFEQTGDLADLDAAIFAGQQAVNATPLGHPDRAGWLANLCGALSKRFEQTGDRADLDAAIAAGQQAAAAASVSHPDRAAILVNLSAALRIRLERFGDLADLDAAITAGQQAVDAAPVGHPNRAAILANLGGALTRRFERTGERADLDAAITAGQQAVDAAPVGHPNRTAILANLGGALTRRFERTGEQADLDAAITAGQQAVDATPVGHPNRAIYLSNLAIALRARFERTGDRADLDATIAAGQQAVDATPAGHLYRAMYLSNLAIALTARFDRADLDAAITAGQQAVDATPADHPERARYLSNLTIALRIRSERTGDRADLDAAITAGQQAVDATPADHPERARYLSNLAIALRARSERTGDRADLDAAITAGQQAVDATPADHPERAGWLSNLAIALRIRSERTGDRPDLDAAITAGQQAVDATPADHPDRAVYLSNLAIALRIRFERFGDLADLDAAIDVGRQAVAVTVAPPRVRAVAARGWGRAAGGGRRWREAVAGFAAAAELAGLVAPRSLTRGDQEYLLEDLGGLAADAVACCVHAGLVDRAVELFEQGRGVLLGQALDTRTDLTTLTEQHPGLAARFTALRDDLDRADDPAGPLAAMPTGTEMAATEGRAEAARRGMERRRAAATAFDQVIAEIRELPDFHGFLRPPRLTELAAAASEGPVVIVAVSGFGSHALILTGSGVLASVPLAGLTPETVYDQVVAFLGALDDAWSPAAGASDRAVAEQRLGDMLRWLWEELAAPVLARLGITGPPGDGQPWPRLWWCVSGLLSFLPVHAAGHHDTRTDAAPATVIDRVISSYTPTLRALAHARRPAPATVAGAADQPRAEGPVVAVAMPHTPGASDLPGAQEEVIGLQQLLPGQVTALTGSQATHDTVLAALPAGRWAHFACHGASDPSNPSASCLLLTDHRQRPLTVVDMARLRLDDARLAFLSACSTAQPGGRLADEAIHLASAFQLAGYRQVIATLWPVGDQHAVDLAADIYTDLITVSDGDVAGAVHTAVRRMRRRWGWDTPSVWASHIHTGG